VAGSKLVLEREWMAPLLVSFGETMRKFFCDICKRPYNPVFASKTLAMHGIIVQIAYFHQLPNGAPGQQADICTDCLVQGLTEEDVVKRMDAPDGKKGV
jgi:hypothetical protein